MYLHPVCKFIIISGAGMQTITDHPVGSNHNSPHKRDRANDRAKVPNTSQAVFGI